MRRYSRSSKETGIGRGQYARVTGVYAPNNRLTVELKDGAEMSPPLVTYDQRRQQGEHGHRHGLGL